MTQKPKPHIPLPADTFIDTVMEKATYRQINHWLDEAYENCAKNGGLDHLSGKGKPLKVPEGNVLDSILKNANVSHPWLMLRQEIKEQIICVVELLESKPDDPLINDLLVRINEKIIHMNIQAPGLNLHRKKITRQNIHSEVEKWV